METSGYPGSTEQNCILWDPRAILVHCKVLDNPYLIDASFNKECPEMNTIYHVWFEQISEPRYPQLTRHWVAIKAKTPLNDPLRCHSPSAHIWPCPHPTSPFLYLQVYLNSLLWVTFLLGLVFNCPLTERVLEINLHGTLMTLGPSASIIPFSSHTKVPCFESRQSTFT